MKTVKQINNLINTISEISDDEIKNDPKVEEIVQNFIKDLPPELTKKEARKLTEKERRDRNRKIYDTLYEIADQYNADDDVARIYFMARKEAGQIPTSYEHLREGAIRGTALQKAITICESRIINSKKELNQIKNIYKEIEAGLQKTDEN